MSSNTPNNESENVPPELPKWQDLFSSGSIDEYHGFVDKKEEFEDLKWHYEVDTKSHFVAVKTIKTFGNTDIYKKQHKIQWRDPEKEVYLPDHPYIVLNVERYECHHGPDRNKTKKNKLHTEQAKGI